MTADAAIGSVPVVRQSTTEPGRWTVPGAFLFTALVVGSAMVSGILVQQGYLTWRFGSSAMLDLSAAKRLATIEQRHLFVAMQLIAQFLQLGLIWLLVSLWHDDRKAALGLWGPNHGLGGWFKAIALLFAVKVAATMVTAGVSPGSTLKEAAPFGEVVRSELALLGFLAAVMLAGATEELVFRGVLSRTLEASSVGFWLGAALMSGCLAYLISRHGYVVVGDTLFDLIVRHIVVAQIVLFAGGLTLAWVLSRTFDAKWLNFWFGAAAASGSFALLHFQYGPAGQFVVFAIGMTLAWIRMRSQSLWPAIICHAINNGVAIVALKALG